MKYNPEKHNRRSIRLKNYNYSQSGAYFITICTNKRECLFGKIINGEMILNEYGKIVKNCWLEIPQHFPNVELDEFIIMPNHIHGIIVITENENQNIVENDIVVNTIFVGAIHELPLRCTNDDEIGWEKNNIKQRRKMLIPKIVGRFKMNVAKHINQIRQTPGVPVWQRNYYEHIIRNKIELYRIIKYIIHNPLNWESDNNYQKQNNML